MKPAWYVKQANAERLAARVRAAYPHKTFEVVHSPHNFKWGVAIIADAGFRVQAYVGRPRGPMPGERSAPKLESWEVTYTDTANGEANYSWTNRYTLTVREDLSRIEIMRRAKKEAELTGRKGQTTWFDNASAEFKPRGSHTVLFVNFLSDEIL